MARYYMLLNWTEQGAKNSKDTVTRAAAARQMAEKMGARVTDCVWTMGQYDLILSAEAPDDETITAVGIALGKLGNVRTQTLRAFGENEMQKILQKV
jgi:uncharacterized protein with GYD domain